MERTRAHALVRRRRARGAFRIRWLCDTTLRRGLLAAGIYLGVQLARAPLLGAIS